MKELRATNQPCRVKNEPQGEFVSKVPPPRREWSINTKRIYKSVMEYLMVNNLLTIVNMPLATSFALNYGRYLDFERDYQNNFIDERETKSGTSRSVKPEWRIMQESFDKALKVAGEFGLTPSAAAKIARPEEKNKDPFAAL